MIFCGVKLGAAIAGAWANLLLCSRAKTRVKSYGEEQAIIGGCQKNSVVLNRRDRNRIITPKEQEVSTTPPFGSPKAHTTTDAAWPTPEVRSTLRAPGSRNAAKALAIIVQQGTDDVVCSSWNTSLTATAPPSPETAPTIASPGSRAADAWLEDVLHEAEAALFAMAVRAPSPPGSVGITGEGDETSPHETGDTKRGSTRNASAKGKGSKKKQSKKTKHNKSRQHMLSKRRNRRWK